ncbi:hypothetical protein TNCT_298501, partial [Trichonephila clavata]
HNSTVPYFPQRKKRFMMRKERRRHDDENVGRTRLVLPEGKTGSSGRGEHLRKYPPQFPL